MHSIGPWSNLAAILIQEVEAQMGPAVELVQVLGSVLLQGLVLQRELAEKAWMRAGKKVL